MKLRYEIICQRNIIQASRIQYQIFPYSCAYMHYLKNMNNEELPLELLVYYEDKPIGVMGLYEIDDYQDTIWLSWFGILEQYRKKGIGTKMLEDIKIFAKKYKKKFLRLHTYEIWNATAQPFYKKRMEISEYYNNEREKQENIKEGKPKIYGSSLCDEKIKYWNNKFINITKDDNTHEESIKLMKKHGIIK